MLTRKMYIVIVIVIVIVAFTIVFLSVGCQKMRHPVGKDTVKSFGDGTYQIQRQSIDKRNELVNLEKSQTIIYDVKKYRQVNKNVFAIGDDKYVLLKYAEGVVEIYNNLTDIPDNYKSEFEKLER